MLFYIDAARLQKLYESKKEDKMFLVTDLTGKVPYTTAINDVKTVRDVIVGITGESRVGDAILGIVGHMSFGNEFICHPRFKVKCVKDADVEMPIAQSIAMVATRLLATCTDDYERLRSSVQPPTAKMEISQWGTLLQLQTGFHRNFRNP